MRESLLNLINKTITYRYDLPNKTAKISKTIYSTDNDKCYSAHNSLDIAKIIYNSIIEYSFNEHDISVNDYNSLHTVALKTKLKYNQLAKIKEKLKYGFFGEVLLYSILIVMYKAKPLIARGYFYSPLENSETKGYDSYQLIEYNDITELWFGEVKFHAKHSSGIDSVLANIHKALSDSYLEKNVLSIYNHKNNLNLSGSKIGTIINNWDLEPEINIVSELKKYNMKLVYPVLLLYEEDKDGYDSNIQKIPEYIFDKYSAKTFALSVDYSVFFILLPLKEVKDIKTKVIQWIESKEQLML